MSRLEYVTEEPTADAPSRALGELAAMQQKLDALHTLFRNYPLLSKEHVCVHGITSGASDKWGEAAITLYDYRKALEILGWKGWELVPENTLPGKQPKWLSAVRIIDGVTVSIYQVQQIVSETNKQDL